MRRFIIPDTHGCLKTFRFLLEEVLKLRKTDSVYMLGDYLDRGPDSAGLIEYLINLKGCGFTFHCLRGNHEQLMLDALADEGKHSLWMLNSGNDTLESYYRFSKKHPSDNGPLIPNAHIKFIESLPYYHVVDDKFILVHGGINYRSEDPFNDHEAMLWKRPEAMPDDILPGYKIIHGHTPTTLASIQQVLEHIDNRLINLDAGCVYHGVWQGIGYLTALDIDSWALTWVERID